MPAAAVIPAPLVYIKVVAVKKLVVGYLSYARLTGYAPFRRKYILLVGARFGILFQKQNYTDLFFLFKK